ncbi:MAG: hypothetical protein IPM12_00530 [Flavobacteriales bacterium]|nr:hypothetical protein [Flavobacteriales bacterium]
MRTWILTFILGSIGHAAFTQHLLDGAYIREHAPTRRPVPLALLREADVLFCKCVRRVLDVREKITPRSSSRWNRPKAIAASSM